MAKKSKKGLPQEKAGPEPRESAHWRIVAIVAILVAGGLLIKVAFFPAKAPAPVLRVVETTPPMDKPFDRNEPLELGVQLVAMEFRCACGGCGELPLIDCNCDMPRGAVEEKRFIRDRLRQGLAVEQIIRAVEARYGHRIS